MSLTVGRRPSCVATLSALGLRGQLALGPTATAHADLFAEPSPVLHFWSLAIEEQFYLVFPLAFAGYGVLGGAPAGRLGRRRLGLAAAASFARGLSAGRSGNDGLAYYGTHTRAGELLVGVALAFVLGRPAGPGARRRRRAPTGQALGTTPAAPPGPTGEDCSRR